MLEKYARKLFTGLSKFKFNASGEVIGVITTGGEELMLRERLGIQELALKDLEFLKLLEHSLKIAVRQAVRNRMELSQANIVNQYIEFTARF